jgi:hypothetical protein
MTSKEEKLYERYVAEGANALSLDEVRTVLRFQDAEPEAAHNIRQKHETAKRQEDARETFVAPKAGVLTRQPDHGRRFPLRSAKSALPRLTRRRAASWRGMVRSF